MFGKKKDQSDDGRGGSSRKERRRTERERSADRNHPWGASRIFQDDPFRGSDDVQDD